MNGSEVHCVTGAEMLMTTRMLSGLALLMAFICCSPGAGGGEKPDAEVRKRLDAAVKALRSTKTVEVLAAVRTVSASTDGKGWDALRNALLDEKVLAVLEAPGKARMKAGLEEGTTYGDVFAELAGALNAVAQSDPGRGVATLKALLADGQYASEKGGKESKAPWRRRLVYAACAHLREPSAEVYKYLAGKLAFRAEEGNCQFEIMRVLTAHGTATSIELFKKRVGASAEYELLILHRNKYENVKFLLSTCSSASNKKFAHRMLGKFFAESLPGASRGAPAVKLPPIAPKAREEAEKFAKLFEDFVAKPGKLKLTDGEKANFARLIARMKKIAKNKAKEDKS